MQCAAYIKVCRESSRMTLSCVLYFVHFHKFVNYTISFDICIFDITGMQLPPTCGVRQLSKLKRFLTTLQQFGSDISPDIGERVRGLIVNLVVSRYYNTNLFL